MSRLPSRPDWDCTGAASGVPAKAALNSTAPGAPFTYPAGYGVELAPGDALLLYAHLVPSEIRAPSRYGIALRRPTSRSAPRCPTAGARRLSSNARPRSPISRSAR